MRRRRSALALAPVVLGLASTVVPIVIASPAAAAPMTFVVTNQGTSGAGSFVQAVLDANANPGHDTITFAPNVEHVGALATVTITDPVRIDGCGLDGDPTKPNWVELRVPQINAVVVDAADVHMQGFAINGGLRPIDVTPNGDYFVYEGAQITGTYETFRVNGAYDVRIGGFGAPIGCVDDAGANRSVRFLPGASGIELVDASAADIVQVELDRVAGTALRISGGDGNKIDRAFITQDPQGLGIDTVELVGTGTEFAPTELFNSRITSCRRDCVVVSDDSDVRIGQAAGLTDIHGFDGNTSSAAIRVNGSSATIQGVVAEYGGQGAIVVGPGSHDVLIEGNELVNSGGAGVVVRGTPGPTDVTIRDNDIGVTARNTTTGATIPPVALPNLLGVLLESGHGVTVEHNVVASNQSADIVVVDGIGDAHTDIAVRDNLVGLDPDAQRPRDPNGVALRSVQGIRVAAVPNVVVADNTVADTTAQGIVVEGASAGTGITGNQVGLAGHPAGASGVLVSSSGVIVDGNTVGPAGVGIDVRAPEVTVAENAVGGNGTGIAVRSGADVLDNTLGLILPGNGIGIDVIGDDNLLRGNTVVDTTAGGTPVRVQGQRNTVTQANMYRNGTHAIRLLATILGGPANGGIVPPTVSLARVSGQRLRVAGTATLPSSNGKQASGVVDVYANRACTAAAHDAEQWLGQIPVQNTRFDGNVAAAPAGYPFITVTTTDSQGNTSELSSCVTATSGGVPPIPSFP